jgi:hypothetical protein
MNEAEFSSFHSNVKRGDIVGVKGFPGLCCYEFIDSLSVGVEFRGRNYSSIQLIWFMLKYKFERG